MQVELRYAGELQKIERKPGDILVLRVDGPLDEDTGPLLKQQLQAALGDDVTCLVMEDGMRLDVITPNE